MRLRPLYYISNSGTRNLALPNTRMTAHKSQFCEPKSSTQRPLAYLLANFGTTRASLCSTTRGTASMLRTVLMLAFFVSSCSSLHTPAVASRSRPVVMMPGPGKAWETANVPRGRVVMNPFENLKQMQDQRVAGLSHVNLAPGKCTLPLQEAIALMKQWKEEIGDDAEKFAERVSRSRCEAAA